MLENQLLTLPQTQAKLEQDHLHVSLYAIRRWVADGTLPALKSGNRTLIHYPTALAILVSGSAERKVV